MTRLLLTVLAASLCINAPSFAQDEAAENAPWNNAAEVSVGPVVAFVGEKVFVEERKNKGMEEVILPDGQTITRMIPNLFHGFQARYKIIESIGGEYKKPEIDFETFDHDSVLVFPKINPILRFAVNRDGRWDVSQYPIYVVHETTDGDWGICGSAAKSYRSEQVKALAATYEEPLGFLGLPNTQAAAEACVTGTRAANIFAFEEETRFGPLRRRRACNREMGEKDNVIHARDLSPEAELKVKIHAACVSRLEAEDNL